MSAYAHQMEREYSTQSLSSSRGGSDMGSHYVVESGIYMTSFAATIFIGALTTIGVLLITLLIALVVMLQSCQIERSGAVDSSKSSDYYSYCKIFTLHAEINSLEVNEFPSVCKDFAIQYIKEGQYAKDFKFTMWLAEKYFSTVTPLGDGLDALLLDIDDFHSSNPLYNNLYRFDQNGCNECIEETKDLKHKLILRFCMKLQAGGWSLILLSRKPEKQRNATIEHLTTAGYGNWSSLIMRSDDEMQMDTHEYFSRQRGVIQKEGFRITAVISGHMDALTGPSLGKRIFKLPNPMYYKFDDHIESANLLK